MNAFYLTTGWHPDREANVLREIERAGLTPRRHLATPVNEATHCAPELLLRGSVGEISCSESHARIWQRVVNYGLSWALVVEDDATIRTSREGLEAHVAALPDGWHLGLVQEHWLNKSGHHWVEDGKDSGPLWARVRLAEFGTFGYLVSQAGARWLLARLVPLSKVVDVHFRWWASYCRAYHSRRALVHTGDFSSTIGGARSANKPPFAHEFAFVVTVSEEPPELVAACLASIRQHYPAEAIEVVMDGQDPEPHRAACEAHGARLTPWERLKVVDAGALWWHRTWSIGGRNFPRWIVKLDPDTRIRARLTQFPGDVFGRLENCETDVQNLQGGFQVFGYWTADKLALLAVDPGWRDPERWNHNEWTSAYVARGEISTNWLLMALMKSAGISAKNSAEISSHWRPTHHPESACVVHPIKDPGL